MTVLIYHIALVVHFLGLIGLFGGFILYHRAMPALRSASTVEEARPWFDVLAATGRMHIGGLGFLLISGLLMAFLRWREFSPFATLGLLGIVLIGFLTGGVSGRWLGRVGAELQTVGDGRLPSPLRTTLSESTPWVATSAANGMALAILWIMTDKPGWVGSVAVLCIAGAAGAWLGALIARREPGTGG